MSGRAGSSWTADAERYDTWFDQPWGRYASRVERDAVLAAAGDLTGADVADIGCGTGRLTRHLRQHAGLVVGALNQRSAWGLANRGQFRRPPWAGARFLSAAELRLIGEAHGTVTIRPALYPPTALPLIEQWGPTVERIGRVVASRWGAFNVMTIAIARPSPRGARG